MHLTDALHKTVFFNDRYFQGIDFDLSKIFIFSFNDESRIDRILKKIECTILDLKDMT